MFFKPWNETVKNPANGNKVAFEDACVWENWRQPGNEAWVRTFATT